MKSNSIAYNNHLEFNSIVKITKATLNILKSKSFFDRLEILYGIQRL